MIDLFLQTQLFCLSTLHLFVFLFNIESRKKEKTSKCNYIISEIKNTEEVHLNYLYAEMTYTIYYVTYAFSLTTAFLVISYSNI